MGMEPPALTRWGMGIGRAGTEDAGEILDLQKRAYRSEAEICGDYTIAPLTQSFEEIEAEFETRVFLEATKGGRIIGSVRADMRQGTCLIGRLIVHPDFQNRGVGAALMREIEKRFSQTARFELFTGHESLRNLHLYHKPGFRIFRREKAGG